MKKIKLFIATLSLVVLGGLAVLPSAPAMALDTSNPLGEVCSGDSSAACEKSTTEDAGGIVGRIVNVLLFIIGALAVVMIIFGGIRYATSAGNAQSVSAAKNIIMYSIVGLILAFLAFAIVNWVLKLF